jgi:predicted RNA polymerase sigma factor
VRSAVEAAVRESYGRLVALLAARTRDLAAAEDALADALVGALTTWPTAGIPDNPRAWLMTTARNRLLDQLRHHVSSVFHHWSACSRECHVPQRRVSVDSKAMAAGQPPQTTEAGCMPASVISAASQAGARVHRFHFRPP